MTDCESGRILLADDDPAIRLMGQEALESAGHRVLCFEDGRAALESIPPFRPDVLLLDVRMPGIDGFDACQQARRFYGDHLPIVMLTALDDDESIEEAYQAGATDYFVKPIQWLILLQRLRYILRAAKTLGERIRMAARNEAILSAVPDTFILMDRQGTLLDLRIAAAFQPHLRCPARSGQNLEKAFPAVLSQACLARLGDLRRPQRWDWSIASSECIRHFQTCLVACGREGGLAIVRDITEAKKAELELCQARRAAEAASRAKSQFLDNMNHELRTPLNAIMGMTELVLDSDLNAEQHDFLSTVKLSAERLENLISEVLDFSKIEAGELELVESEFPLQDALRDALAPLAYEAQLKQLDLACEVDARLPSKVRADQARLRQILVNLAHNAVKFTQSGEVLVGVTLDSQSEQELWLRFEIRDTGVGIDPSVQKSIFESFCQADGSSTREFDGAGLGLTVAARLLRLMKGRLWLDSAPGRGSTFSFLLPVRRVKDDGEVKAHSRWLSGRCVLVADIHPASRRIVRQMLQAWGCRVLEAETAGQVLDTLARADAQAQAVQIVLIGEELAESEVLARQIRKDDAWKGVRLLLLSAQGCRQSGPLGKAGCGLQGVLPKPVMPAHLLEALQPLAALFADSDRGSWKVLLLDSDRIHRRMAKRLLLNWGLEVVAADQPESAAQALKKGQFHLLLAAEDLLARPNAPDEDWRWINESGIPLAVFADVPADRIQLPCRPTARLSKPVSKKDLFSIIEAHLAPPDPAVNGLESLAGRAE